MSKASLFLKLEGITGASNDGTHKGAIEIDSFSVSASRQNGAPHVGTLDCSAPTSTADPKLWKACIEPKEIIKKVTLVCRVAGTLDYATVTLTDCKIIGVSWSGAEAFARALGALPGPIVPSERSQFSISFAKFEFEVKEIKPDQTLAAATKYGYDLIAHKTV